MALCPFAKHRLIDPGANDPRIKPRVAILHVAVSEQSSLHDYFDGPSGGIESHFYVQRDGGIEQYRDTVWQADANYLANDFAVSIETQGMGAGEWTPEQMVSIKRLLRWLHEAEDIPLRVCDGPYGSGVGYHVMWGAPGPWTPVSKSCPGPDRIRQFRNDLTPWLNAGARIANLEDDMPSADEVADKVVERLTSDKGPRGKTIEGSNLTLWQLWDQTHNRVGDTRERMGRANDYNRQVRAQVKAIRDRASTPGASLDEIKRLLDAAVADMEHTDAAELADQLDITTKEK